MFRDGQALVKDVVKTANEVKAIGKEVQGIWGWLSSLFGEPEKETRTIQDLKPKKQKVVFDEQVVLDQIAEDIVTFYKNFYACANAIREEEEKIEKIYDPDGDTYERAIRLVMAKTNLERMGTDLTEFMVYHVPPELKDVYTRVNEMIGNVKVKQELARKAQIRHKAEILAKERELKDKIWFRTASTIAVCIVAIYLMGLMWAINRMSHGGM